MIDLAQSGGEQLVVPSLFGDAKAPDDARFLREIAKPGSGTANKQKAKSPKRKARKTQTPSATAAAAAPQREAREPVTRAATAVSAEPDDAEETISIGDVPTEPRIDRGHYAELQQEWQEEVVAGNKVRIRRSVDTAPDHDKPFRYEVSTEIVRTNGNTDLSFRDFRAHDSGGWQAHVEPKFGNVTEELLGSTLFIIVTSNLRGSWNTAQVEFEFESDDVFTTRYTAYSDRPPRSLRPAKEARSEANAVFLEFARRRSASKPRFDKALFVAHPDKSFEITFS